MHIGFIGSGKVAQALGKLLLAAGQEVSFGTRAATAALDARTVSLEQATEAEVVILAVPFLATRDVLPRLVKRLEGKVVIDATNPVNADWSPMLLGQESSGGEEVARALPGARVVKAFNTIFADVMREDRLIREGGRVTCFVATDDAAAGQVALGLASTAGFSARLVGGLHVARQLEAMAHLNIQMAVGMKGGTNAAFLYHQAG
jgi:predicted dinucleotide-binding enzyme